MERGDPKCPCATESVHQENRRGRKLAKMFLRQHAGNEGCNPFVRQLMETAIRVTGNKEIRP